MGRIIAVSGKGGVGKTTICALIIKQLIENDKTPVLAIDADPNSCLDAALGVTTEKTVGSVREQVREEVQKGLSGISKQDMLRLNIAESLVESDGFDMIAMGRPEGPGCYCYANNVLKSVIAEISGQYPYVVLDNEAGLENLSRRIVQKVDVLIMISDPSNAGLNTLNRLHALAQEMEIKYDKLIIVVNRVRGELPPKAEQIKADTNADEVIALPDDAEIAAFAEQGRCLFEMTKENKTVNIIDRFIQKL